MITSHNLHLTVVSEQRAQALYALNPRGRCRRLVYQCQKFRANRAIVHHVTIGVVNDLSSLSSFFHFVNRSLHPLLSSVFQLLRTGIFQHVRSHIGKEVVPIRIRRCRLSVLVKLIKESVCKETTREGIDPRVFPFLTT